METLSFVALILLSLVGYSIGATIKAGKSVQLKPQILDLVIMSFIWSGVIYSRVVFDLNKWLIILVWIALSIMIGVLATWSRKLAKERVSIDQGLPQASGSLPHRIWQSWGNISGRMGNFQSRIILSLFFFILVLPFALIAKLLSDPLRIRYQESQSHWLTKLGTETSLERFRRQF